jgi:iron complex outermembrane receptor protein
MFDSFVRRLFVGAVLVLSLAVTSAPALAQAPASTPAESAAESADNPEDQPVVLDEIFVTPQKREENIQQVPLSMSTLDSDQLQTLSNGGGDVRVLAGRVPSLVIESSFGRAFPRFYIRGLGNTDFDLNASQPVSMVVDDIVLENPVVKGMPLWDLDHVEVLRGPQGTLFGRNTPAGVVKFDTKRPSQQYDGWAQASYGTFGNTDVQAAVGGGLTPTLSARGSLLYQSQNDWVDNGFTGKNNALGGYKTTAFRGQLLWEPTKEFNALLNLHGWNVSDGTARIFRANILKPGTNDLVDGYSQDKVFQDGKNQQDISSRGGALKMNYELGNATLTSVTGYETLHMLSRGDIDGGFGCAFCGLPNGPGFVPFPSESADGIPDLDQFTEELRIASHTGGKWDWLGGLFYFDEKLKAETHSYASLAPGNPQDGFATQKQDAKSWALFGSLDFRPSEKWAFKGGLRYTKDEKDFSAERLSGGFLPPTTSPLKASTDADLITGDFSATYKVDENVNVYGRIGTGFRAPSIQGRILFADDPDTNGLSVAKEEKIKSAEIGVKSELLDRRLRANFAIYQYQVDNQQLVAVGGTTNTARLINANRTDGYGFEANVDIAPTSSWLINLGGSYNHTKIDDPSLQVGRCFSCTVTDPTPNGYALIDGNPLPNAPEWIFDGIVDYRRPVASGLLVASFDWAYQSDKSFFLYQSKEFHADSLEFGLKVGYTFADAKYEVNLFARNLTDEKIVQGGIDFDNLTGMTNEPRLIGVQFVTRFGK